MYDHQQIDQQIGAGSIDWGGTGTAEMAIGTQPIIVRALWATVDVVQASASAVLTFTLHPVPGASTNQTVLGTLTVTAGVVGRQFYKNITPVKAMPGSVIVVTTDGGGTGEGMVGIRYTPSWEMPANNTAQIASA